jgi:hypothetical protein
MRVFACYVLSKLQRHRCPTFGALRFRTNNAQTDSYIFIYIDRYIFCQNATCIVQLIVKHLETKSYNRVESCRVWTYVKSTGNLLELVFDLMIQVVILLCWIRKVRSWLLDWYTKILIEVSDGFTNSYLNFGLVTLINPQQPQLLSL